MAGHPLGVAAEKIGDQLDQGAFSVRPGADEHEDLLFRRVTGERVAQDRLQVRDQVLAAEADVVDEGHEGRARRLRVESRPGPAGDQHGRVGRDERPLRQVKDAVAHAQQVGEFVKFGCGDAHPRHPLQDFEQGLDRGVRGRLHRPLRHLRRAHRAAVGREELGFELRVPEKHQEERLDQPHQGRVLALLAPDPAVLEPDQPQVQLRHILHAAPVQAAEVLRIAELRELIDNLAARLGARLLVASFVGFRAGRRLGFFLKVKDSKILLSHDFFPLFEVVPFPSRRSRRGRGGASQRGKSDKRRVFAIIDLAIKNFSQHADFK